MFPGRACLMVVTMETNSQTYLDKDLLYSNKFNAINFTRFLIWLIILGSVPYFPFDRLWICMFLGGGVFDGCYHGNELTNLSKKCLFQIKQIQYYLFQVFLEFFNYSDISRVLSFWQVLNFDVSIKRVFGDRYHGNEPANLS